MAAIEKSTESSDRRRKILLF